MKVPVDQAEADGGIEVPTTIRCHRLKQPQLDGGLVEVMYQQTESTLKSDGAACISSKSPEYKGMNSMRSFDPRPDEARLPGYTN